MTSSRVDVRLTVNGTDVEARVEARELLADTVRDRLGLTGAHVACGDGSCGACLMLVDGVATRSCTVFTVQVPGAAVTTIEGLAPGGTLHPVQLALSRCHGLQCGFCTPGVVLAAVALLAGGEPLDEERVRDAMAGQLCRCTGYAGIVDAVLAAAAGAADAPREDGS